MPTIVCGDWNDSPDSACLQLIQNTIGIRRVGNHEYTTHKFRESSGMQTRCIDYMYYFEKMPGQVASEKITAVSGQYNIPERSELPDTGYPSRDYPSDHLSLGY